MPGQEPIQVTSHVSRDFLQNAAIFNTMPKLVWEYVSNSLDASKEGIPAVVSVDITSNYVKISDNGRGMSRNELKNFFQMHGENIQRKKGKRTRGRFGTGKSAAFGLANSLKIDTTQDGIRNVVELKREKIVKAEDGKPFPVKNIVVDEKTSDDDGTIVEVRDFNIKRPKVDKVISFIEKHLSSFRKKAHVTINGHVCQFQEPPSIEQFIKKPPPEVSQHIGDNVELVVKISPIPLDTDTKGIDILSHGIWHETTLAGIESKDRANYIFGEVDVPILEDGEWKIPTFDNTRNNILNRQNPIVVVLLGWISDELEEIRKILVKKEKEKRESEIQQQLEKEAERIEEVLNDDFIQQELELELRQRIATRSGDKSVDEILDEKGSLFPGDGDETTPFDQTGQPHGQGNKGQMAGEGETPRPGPSLRPGDEKGSKRSAAEGRRKRRRSVFSIEYEHATKASRRSRYDADTKTININMDHPQIASAFDAGGRQTKSRQFREISYEVAVVEYALALPYERLERMDYYPAEEALFDVSETIDRVTKRFVKLLSQ